MTEVLCDECGGSMQIESRILSVLEENNREVLCDNCISAREEDIDDE